LAVAALLSVAAFSALSSQVVAAFWSRELRAYRDRVRDTYDYPLLTAFDEDHRMFHIPIVRLLSFSPIRHLVF
jgi:hypothetical protein